MTEQLLQIYKSLEVNEQKEMLDFANFLLFKKSQKFKTNPLKEFSGVISDDDAQIMLEAIDECRRIEPNEW